MAMKKTDWEGVILWELLNFQKTNISRKQVAKKILEIFNDMQQEKENDFWHSPDEEPKAGHPIIVLYMTGHIESEYTKENFKYNKPQIKAWAYSDQLPPVKAGK